MPKQRQRVLDRILAEALAPGQRAVRGNLVYLGPGGISELERGVAEQCLAAQ
jgi:hypothetical protein